MWICEAQTAKLCLCGAEGRNRDRDRDRDRRNVRENGRGGDREGQSRAAVANGSKDGDKAVVSKAAQTSTLQTANKQALILH